MTDKSEFHFEIGASIERHRRGAVGGRGEGGEQQSRDHRYNKLLRPIRFITANFTCTHFVIFEIDYFKY